MLPKFSKKQRYWVLALALALVTVLIATVGTVAWLRYERSLQTVTLIHVSDLELTGPNEGNKSTAINLGEIDLAKEGHKYYYVFGVKSNYSVQYRVQLAYTTNVPFEYKIYKATESDNLPSSVTYTQENTKYYSLGEPLTLEDKTPTNDITYDGYTNVQKNAMPKYLQSSPGSDAPTTTPGVIQYYVLEISWPNNVTVDLYNKETDMIYLTVGTVSTSNAGGNS